MKFLTAVVCAIFLVGCGTLPKHCSPPSPDQANVQPVVIGPMIGNVTDNSIRLWGKGTEQSIGVAHFRELGAGEWSTPVPFSLPAQTDYTGTVENKLPLKPGTAYEYQIGYVHENWLGQLDKIVWGDDVGRVHTFPAVGSNVPTRFIFGSCRDQTIWSKKGEDTFGNINSLLVREAEIPGETQSQFIIQAGDQVYADLAGFPYLKPKGHKNIEAFWKTYRKAFGRSNFETVTGRLANYMILDDHEVENDWSKGRFKTDYDPQVYELGIRAYMAYQGSLNLSQEETAKYLNGVPAEQIRLWYKFNHGNADFFVMDTRSSNEMSKKFDSSQADPDIISFEQMNDLKCWLGVSPEDHMKCDGNRNGHIKFIVSPVPVFPDTKGPGGAPRDKWGGHIWQRHNLLEFIRKNNIKRVVFLSGDVHASYIAEMIYCPPDKACDDDFKIYNIVSSPFNWSSSAGWGLYSFNFDFDFDWHSMKRQALGTAVKLCPKVPRCDECCKTPSANYFVRRYWNDADNKPSLLHTKNNFSRITADNDRVTVEFFSGHQKEKLLEKSVIQFK